MKKPKITRRCSHATIRVIERHEQGHPEVIEVEYKGKWLRYVLSNNQLDSKMDEFIKKNLSQ